MSGARTVHPHWPLAKANAKACRGHRQFQIKNVCGTSQADKREMPHICFGRSGLIDLRGVGGRNSLDFFLYSNELSNQTQGSRKFIPKKLIFLFTNKSNKILLKKIK